MTRLGLVPFAILCSLTLPAPGLAELRASSACDKLQQPAFRFNVTYTCGGERLVISHCRSEAHDAYCSVSYPDRRGPSTKNLVPVLAEKRGELIKKLQACGALAAPTIRFDGLYRTVDSQYVRFYEDGTVIGVGIRGKLEDVARILKKPYGNTGRYAVQGSTISFSLVSQDRLLGGIPVKGGTVSYTGTIGANSLSVNWHSSLNGRDGVGNYEFVPIPELAKPQDP